MLKFIKKHKWICVLVGVVILMYSIINCISFSFEGDKEFKKYIMKKYDFINDIVIRHNKTSIFIDFSLSRAVDLADVGQVFEDTRKFIFSEKVFLALLEAYRRDESGNTPWDITIFFDSKNDKNEDYRFYSRSQTSYSSKYFSFEEWWLTDHNDSVRKYISMPKYELSFDGDRQFKNRITEQYNFIKDISFTSSKTTLFINCALSQEIDLINAKEVFEEIRKYILTERVFADLQSAYLQAGRTEGPGNIKIDLDYLTTDEITDYRFGSNIDLRLPSRYDRFKDWFIIDHNGPAKKYNAEPK